MSSIVGVTEFKITNTKLCVPIVTLSSKDNVKLVIKLFEKGFKRPVYWIEHQTKIESRDLDNNNFTRFPLFFKELKDCLFLLLTILIMVLTKLKKKSQKVFSLKSKHNKLQRTNRWQR